MLRREIMAVCSQIHTAHINTLCGQDVEFVDIKPGGLYSDHWASDGSVSARSWRNKTVNVRQEIWIESLEIRKSHFSLSLFLYLLTVPSNKTANHTRYWGH